MAVVTGHTCNVTGFYGSKPKEERQRDCPACQRQSLYAKGRGTDKPKAPLMSEPTNEELRQACERLRSSIYTDVQNVVSALLSRLDREAEAERRLKVAREALGYYDRGTDWAEMDGSIAHNALAEIAPAAPEGEKP